MDQLTRYGSQLEKYLFCDTFFSAMEYFENGNKLEKQDMANLQK